MQNISTTLSTELLDNGQYVSPFVEAEWVNGRSLRNVKGYSSSDDYVDFVKAQNPVFYTRLNESFDVIENMYTGPKPITHWRMNNITTITTGSANTYAVQDEIGYNNLFIKGASGTNFNFNQTGVVQDNLGALSSSTRFTSSSIANTAYGVSSTRDFDNRWSLADNPNFSLECWFKPDSIVTTTSTNHNFLFYKTSKAYLRNPDNPGQILLTTNIPEWTMNIESSGKLRFIIYNSSSTAYSPLINKSNIYLDVTSSTPVDNTQWWHVVITFDGKNLCMYLNNVLVGSNNAVNGNLMDTSSGSLYIGARYFDWQNSSGVDGAYDTAYRGYIDEISIYNTTLSLSDVKSRWKTGSLNIGPTLRSLNTNHNHIIDYSGKGRNGFVYVPSSPFTGIDFRPTLNNRLATPLTGRKDGASAYFNNGTSVINYSPLTSDNTATGTPVFDGTAKLTVSGWIYVEPVTPVSELVQMIAAYGAPDGTNTNFGASGTVSNGGWYLTLRRQPTTGNVTLSGSIYDSTANSPIVSYTNLPQSQWVHFVFSVDSSNRAIIMVNGNTSTIATSSTSSAVMNANAAWKLFIGARESSFGLQKAYLSELSIHNTNADINAWSMVYQSVISANNFKGINKFYSPLQVINGQKEHTVTWAVLDSLDEQGNVITANGDYYISEREETLTTTDYEYGWWSKVKSDASGNFAVPQKLYIRFDPIYANYIDLYSATKYGRIKSGTIEYQLDGSSSWVSQPFTLTSASTSVAIGATEQIQALRLTITSTQYPNDVARVQEFAPRWTEDISSDVVSFDISKVRENYDSSVPLGATGSNTCNIVLDNTINYANTDLRYNPENVASDLYGIIGPGIKFTVGYNYATSAGTEYIQQGIFYSDNWSIDSDNMTVSISTRDSSGKMQDNSIVDGYIASDITAGESIGELATRSGVPLSKLSIDSNYVNTIIKDKPSVFWRMNETSLNSFSHYFNGFNYLYSHPFADMLAEGNSTTPDPNGLGTKKNTPVASRKVLPRTFYDFPMNELTLEFWIKCGGTANGKTIFNYSTKNSASAFNVKVSSTGYLNTQITSSSFIPTWANFSDIPSTYITPVSGDWGLRNAAVGVINNGLFVTLGSFGSTVYYKKTYRLDLTTKAWTMYDDAPLAMMTGYQQNGAVLNNELYCMAYDTAGGVGFKLMKFNPAAATGSQWTQIAGTGSTPSSTFQSRSIVACNGKIYLIGGNVAGTQYSIYRIYDPSTGAWSSTYQSTFPSGVTSFDASRAVVVGTDIYVLTDTGGFYKWSTTTNTWTTLTAFSPATGSVFYQDTPVIGYLNGSIYVGSVGINGGRQYTYQYSITGNQWTTTSIATMTTTNVNHGACTYDGTSMYVVGGLSTFAGGSTNTHNIQIFNTSTAPATSSSAVSTQTVNDSYWHHIGIVLSPQDASSGTNSTQINYYIDGIAAGSSAISNFSAFRPSGQLIIGAGLTQGALSSGIATGPHTFDTNSIFVGHLRELKLWSSARSRTQLLNSMNAPYNRSKFGAYSSNIYKNTIIASAPVGYWPLDVKLNTLSNAVFIRDISGFDRNGTQNTVGMSNVAGPILNEDASSALNFVTNSYISISNTSILPFEGTPKSSVVTPASPYHFSLFGSSLTKEANMSIEFWMKPAALPTAKSSVINKDSATGGHKEYILSLDTDGTLVFDVYPRGTTVTPAVTLTSTSRVIANAWSHIVLTASGSKLQFFINGKLAGFAFLPDDVYLPSGAASNSPLRIGASLSNGTLNNTAMAHVAIYQRTLSPEEVYNHYVKAGYDIPATSIEDTGKLLCHWPLNQGRFYTYEDIRSTGFAYKFAGRNKANIIPNVTKNGNHLYAYTSNANSNPIANSGLFWKNTGCMAAKDTANNRHYLNYRLGTSEDSPTAYNETDTTNYPTFNITSPISSEIEKSIKFNNSVSPSVVNKNIAYVNYMNNIPMAITATASFSVEMWIKPENVTSKQYLFSRENFATPVGAGTWRLFIDTDGKIKFEIFPTASGAALSITPTGTQAALTINTWNHLVAVFSRQATNNQVDLYNNGNLYATYSWSASSGPIDALEVKTIIGGMGQATTNAFIGSISNIAIYNYVLSAATALTHYTRGKSIYQQVYTDIAVSGDSYWSEMLKIATADIGMFFFDELGRFIYEHGREYDDALNTQHSVVQYEINDGNSAVSTSNKALISGSQTVEVQANKVVVKVYPATSSSVQTTSIWSADAGTSLAICTLASTLSATSTDAISLNLTLNPAGLYEPLWPDSGIVKIDDEFIRYSKSTGSTLFNLERGYWGSTPQSHIAGSVVGEAREFNFEWSSQPVFFVKYPFITGSIFDKTVTASGWRFNGLGGYIRLYPSSKAVPSNKYIVIEGNNPVTKLDNYFHVAGIAQVSGQKNKQNIVEVSENYKDNIRKYGEKILEIDNPLIQDAAYARDLAQFLLKKYSLPVPVLEVRTIGLPHLQLGDRIKINTMDRLSISNGEYWIMSISINFNGGLEQTMTLRKVS